MLNNEFPPLGGGTGVVNYHLFKQFADRDDLLIDLVTSSRSHNGYETEQFSENIVIYKVPVANRNIHHVSNPELLRYIWRGYQTCKKLAEQRNYHLSFAFAGVPAGAISYLLNLKFDLPYIVSLQGPDVPGFEARYNYLYPVLRPVLRQIWGRAAVVTAISREHCRLALETSPGLLIPIIPNGVDTDTFCPGKPRQGDLNILCVGRLIERKGQHYLMRAFAQVCQARASQGIKLTLVGTGDAESRLKKLAAELGIVDQVRFYGFVPKDKMPKVYQEADIFVLPSQNEGMSIALLEGMAAGLPVIVTNTGGTAELVTPGKNGLIIPWADISELTEALGYLIENRNMCREMGKMNRSVVLEYSWPKVARQTIELMNSVGLTHNNTVPGGANQLTVDKPEAQ